ncbi:hypothetical protein [Aestuariicoccus sp. MJ-SS9]|uniref:hypothetical protein n=1 Tax=Aestuariicoccus sp. MJ-SS9 TaxID=3079855 RepID=UPI00290E6FB8|nr:hypothetical protein [Aestuariicoccus sp. MJ-SS9]MDU8913989.1 hypothetical protein [Aestuariicoccus sp. MJ-SS9]
MTVLLCGSSQTHLGTQMPSGGGHIIKAAPDYKNSIKEAISAIEAVFFSINGSKSKSLNEAIRKAKSDGFLLHPALEKGILNIYGWTSDENGVRHASFEYGGAVGENQARLMLVLCACLLNFIISSYQD